MPPAVVFAVTVMLFASAPMAEDFWWTDRPSFALNGELVRDYFASGLHQSPMAALAPCLFKRSPWLPAAARLTWPNGRETLRRRLDNRGNDP